ncbi:dynein heavy chain 12, axonemal, partial [Aplysia californica]|uniref:Dynein heavy chain 12, axonemal n=1 Tax=Aplysia californica TaxID=6500 RepID=A0ABM1W320_APLCA
MSSHKGHANGRASPRTDTLDPLQNKPPAKSGIRPDGFPVLPPIRKPENPRVDPYANSKLLTYRLANTQKSLLMKILNKEAAQVAGEENFYFREHKDDPKPEEPGMPDEMMSQDRRIQMNYRFLKGCVESGPVEAMQHSWAERILRMVPEHLRNAKVLHELLQDLFTEVRTNFENSMRRSMVQHVLIKPEVKGLENERAGPPPSEPAGLDYSQPWHQSFVENVAVMQRRLFPLHPSHQTVLRMCQASLA